MKRYRIQSRRPSGAWRDLNVPAGPDLARACARVRSFDEDGLFSPSYRIVDETGAVVASYKTHAKPTIEEARERVAQLAERDGEEQFAREVRAGAWDHRNDVQAALRGERLRGE
jgi:hypothetical protein